MKKRNIKTIKLNKSVISILGKYSINGGIAKGTEISYCHVGTKVECCAMQ
jgi:hypothetical protein